MHEVTDKHALWDEQIDKFLRNQMAEAEETEFINNMNSDKELKAYVTTTVLLIDEVRNQGQETDRAVFNAFKSATRKELYAAIGKKQSSGARIISMLNTNKWASSIAAIAAMFICIFAMNYSMINDAVVSSANGIAAQKSFIRGGDNQELEATLTRIYNNVDNGRFMASSIVVLEEMYQKTTDNITDDEDEYQYQIGLYLSKAYILNGQKAEAKQILTEMHEIYPKDKKISELLHKLSRTFFWE